MKDNEIVAYADSFNYTSLTGRKLEGKVILGPHEIADIDVDYIWICTDHNLSHRIYQTLIKNGIHSEKIKFLYRDWNYYASEDGKGIISEICGIKIREEYLTDFDILNEIFVDRTYNYMNLKEHTVVIDIGMNIGAASLFFAKNDKVDAVYGFEPFQDTFTQAVSNFELNENYIKNKIHPFNYGLLDSNNTIHVNLTAQESGWRNILSQAECNTGAEIESRDAGEVLNQIISENPESPILIKMDVEGSEYRIFPRLVEEGIFAHVYAVLMEYHGDSNILENILIENGFKVLSFGKKNGLGMLYAIK